MTVNITEHAEAILRAASAWDGTSKFAEGSLVLTACAALFDAGAVTMREAAAKFCDEEGAYEQAGYGLNRAAQNYFRARNGIRNINPASLRTTP